MDALIASLEGRTWEKWRKRSDDLAVAGDRPARSVVEPDMSAVTRGVERTRLAVTQLVVESHQAARSLLDSRTDDDLVIVAKRNPVATADLDDDEKRSAAFDLGVGDAGGAAEVSAADLEPDDVVRMMRDSHLVSLGIADARSRFDVVHAGNLPRIPSQRIAGTNQRRLIGWRASLW